LNPIIAVDVVPFKLRIAKEFGATHTVNGRVGDVRSRILRTLPGGSDVVVDTTGLNAVREQSYELTAPHGRTILVGVPRKGDRMSIDSFPLHFGKRITGSEGGSSDPSYDIPRLIALERSGRFSLDRMITRTYALSEINSAIRKMRTGSVIRVGISMQGD
jgi:S-(hydroxymethyl)glutathione dehydrogenase/alcohol dehydrogenase